MQMSDQDMNELIKQEQKLAENPEIGPCCARLVYFVQNGKGWFACHPTKDTNLDARDDDPFARSERPPTSPAVRSAPVAFPITGG